MKRDYEDYRVKNGKTATWCQESHRRPGTYDVHVGSMSEMFQLWAKTRGLKSTGSTIHMILQKEIPGVIYRKGNDYCQAKMRNGTTLVSVQAILGVPKNGVQSKTEEEAKSTQTEWQ